MGNKVGRNMGLRLDTETSTDLDEFERVTGIEGTTLCRSALKAALDYWKKKGRISFPLVLVEPPEAVKISAPPKPLPFDYKGAVDAKRTGKAAEAPGKYDTSHVDAAIEDATREIEEARKTGKDAEGGESANPRKSA